MQEEIKNKCERSPLWVAGLSYSTGLENELVYKMGATRFVAPYPIKDGSENNRSNDRVSL